MSDIPTIATAPPQYRNEWVIVIKADDHNGVINALDSITGGFGYGAGSEPVGGSCQAAMGPAMDYTVRRTMRDGLRCEVVFAASPVEDKVYAPFTDAQVKALNRWQHRGYFHPFTCDGDRSDSSHTTSAKIAGIQPGTLVATNAGWVCLGCGHKQDWAHGFMADESRHPKDYTVTEDKK